MFTGSGVGGTPESERDRALEDVEIILAEPIRDDLDVLGGRRGNPIGRRSERRERQHDKPSRRERELSLRRAAGR